MAFLNHQETRWAVEAERAYLAEAEGGCQIPIGVYGHIDGEPLLLEAVILSVDGKGKFARLLVGLLADGNQAWTYV